MTKKKIGIIVQRYGAQVNGGAEVHARMIAEKLVAKYDVTVLTSRALDYHTWKPELPAGLSIENGIRVMRFNHTPKADPNDVHHINRMYRGRLWFQKLYRALGRPKWYLKFFPLSEIKESIGHLWLEYQGPAMYELIPYLKEHADSYAAYIFFTYLYYPTAIGIQEVGYKSLFIPTMHDEPAAYFPIFQKVMAAPRRILFNTESEKRFSEKLFPIRDVSKAVVAVGIDPVNDHADPEMLKKFNIQGKYILYVGRIDVAKGCETLLKYFSAYLKLHPGKLTLVLAGKNMIETERHPNIIYPGFVSNEEKEQLMKQAEALVIPSFYESLSLVLLESFACKRPVIVNEGCEVLKDHVEASSGGWKYNNYNSFEKALDKAVTGKQTNELGLNGYYYVTKNYTWAKVLAAFDDAISFCDGINYK